MKKLTVLIFLFCSYFAFSQDILMQNGTINQCSGRFLDSGGIAGSYGNNEALILTICPSVPGEAIRLDFTQFNTEPNEDNLFLYNGIDITTTQFGVYDGNGSPGIVTAANASGCITILFKSDGNNVLTGWNAAISCVDSCQIINAQLDSATPLPDANDYIKVCPNESITLNGSAVFSDDSTGATYEWDLDDGNTINGQRATFSYANPGVYIVNLNIRDTNTEIDPLGCKNNNLLNQVIQVGNTPDFVGTEAVLNSICLGESTTIRGVVNTIPYSKDCVPPVSGTLPLPDGEGSSYESSITVDCYASSQKFNNATDILNVCINIEHSYLGDLIIEIIAPTGERVALKAEGLETAANLGIPWAKGAVDSMSEVVTPGVGYDYCFLPNDTLPTLVEAIQDGGEFPDGNGPDTYTDKYVPAGNYRPNTPFLGLIGASLNGDWTIKITDVRERDNGNIFSWGLDFEDALLPAELSFEPVIDSKSWDADPTITDAVGNVIEVTPTLIGASCYTYRVLDDFGCEYTKEICIDVFPAVNIDAVENLSICSAGSSIASFNLTDNNDIILGAQDSTLFNITYHTSEIDANESLNPIEDPTNYIVEGRETLYVRLESIQSGCFDTNAFEVVVNSIDFSLKDNYAFCINTDGTEVIPLPILDTGLNTTNYGIQWYFNGQELTGETNSSYVPTQGGTYSVVVTDLLTDCVTNTDDPNAITEVNESTPPVLTVSQSSLVFEDDNRLLAIAVFNGAVTNSIIAFEFSLDNGPWVSNTPDDGRYVFENVAAGFHTIRARDKNGCGITSLDISVLDYPVYFTPNGDGINDTWNIIDIDSMQPDAIIRIYDRYGKLLKQISPTGSGWDGTFNNNLMPTDDYWFTLEYSDPINKDRKEFTSHFSLKR